MSHTDDLMIELEELRQENKRQRQMINGLKLNNSKLTNERNDLIDENSKLKYDIQFLKEYRELVHSVVQKTFDESKGKPVWLMNNIGFYNFAHSLGVDVK